MRIKTKITSRSEIIVIAECAAASSADESDANEACWARSAEGRVDTDRTQDRHKGEGRMLRKKRERCADEADDGSSDQTILRRFSGIGVLRCSEPHRETAGDHAGDPCGVVVVLGPFALRERRIGPIEVHAEHFSSIKAEAYLCGIPRWVTEQVGFRNAAEEAMDQTIIRGGNYDGLPNGETAEAIP
jgi:hypothetical protein